VDTLPPLPRDAGDRNRTSSFAFTGNKFEFRAVGSNQSVAGPLLILNTIVAESLDTIADALEKATGGDSGKLNAAVQNLLQEIIRESKSVIFNGDGYSEAWHKEAARRGLPNLRNAVDAHAAVVTPESVALMEKYHVLSKRELQSRQEIYLERYSKDVNTEALLCLNIARKQILPVGYRYQAELAQTAAAMRSVGREPDLSSLDVVTERTQKLEKAIAHLDAVVNHRIPGCVLDHAVHYRDQVIPAMQEVRTICDAMESIISDDLWPLPTYQEMLFIK